MKTTPKMQIIINEIGGKFGVDLSQPGAYLRLDMPGFDRLCIERLNKHEISVAHIWAQNGFQIPEPDVVFFNQEGQGWIPLEITQSMSGRRCYVETTEDRTEILRFDPIGQADLASFVEQWANNLREQGWLDQAVARQTRKGLHTATNQWPEPETEVPRMETMYNWLFVDGDCEATDGCIVEPDGHCPHGYPSWLVYLGHI